MTTDNVHTGNVRNEGSIRPCDMAHIERYGEVYAEAFSGEPCLVIGNDQ